MRILLRHAEAEPNSATGDHGRALSEVGRRQLTALKHWVNECLSDAAAEPLLLASDARRTLETATPIAEEVGARLMAEPRIYEASPASLIALLEEHQQAATVILVGHNPGLSLLASHLSGRQVGLPVAGGVALDASGQILSTHRLP